MASNEIIKISKFTSTQTMHLVRTIFTDPKEPIQDNHTFVRLLSSKLKDTILHLDNEIIVEFLNKKFTFKINSIISQTLNDDISERLKKCKITDDVFYLMNSSSEVQMYDSLESRTKDTRIPLIDIGGMDDIITSLKSSIKLAIEERSDSNKIKISRGCLIHGVSGNGKSMLCNSMAQSFDKCHVIFIDSWKLFSKFYGESEANLKKYFDEAFSSYPTPAIIVIDEISNICPKNDSSDAIKRVSSLLSSLMDSLHVKRQASRTFILANTSHLNNVDPAMRRCGRFDAEIEIPVPTREMREKILQKMIKTHEIGNDWLKATTEVSKHTHGFVGSDLQNLIKKSTEILRTSDEISTKLTFESLMKNLSLIKPSAMRELLIDKPDVRWSDIGGMEDLKLKLKQIVEWPINHPETFERLGIKPPTGLLMFGPPGCSKTMIAKALATESNLNFISIKGSDLFSMWVGESEKAVRDLFVKARQLSPSIVFFDEIDAICGERSADSGSSVKERVLAQILTEMDGVNALKNVIIIAATNRPDLIDSALMRPGRLDRIVYVKLPDETTRREIFKIKLKKIPIGDDVNIDDLVKRSESYSGAEIEAICKEAAMKALENSFDIQTIPLSYFEKAFEVLKPRTSAELLKLYEEYEK